MSRADLGGGRIAGEISQPGTMTGEVGSMVLLAIVAGVLGAAALVTFGWLPAVIVWVASAPIALEIGRRNHAKQIGAAIARSMAASPKRSGTVADRLAELGSLRERGLISDEEAAQRRREILAEV